MHVWLNRQLLGLWQWLDCLSFWRAVERSWVHSPVSSDPFTSATDVLVKSHSLIIARKKCHTSSTVNGFYSERKLYIWLNLYSIHCVFFLSISFRNSEWIEHISALFPWVHWVWWEVLYDLIILEPGDLRWVRRFDSLYWMQSVLP